jgi:DNA invertase Pin-like site-specific DNA recombinase
MSTTKQEASIDQQKDWAGRAAAEHALDVAASFEDPGIPGDEIALRPGLQDMLAFCQAEYERGDPVEVLLTYDADRFSRADSLRTAALLCRFLDCGVSKLVTAEGVIDLEDDTDRLVHNIKQDAAKSAYVKRLSERIGLAAQRYARRGHWLGGQAPYGYASVPTNPAGADKKLARLAAGDALKADAVRWLFSEYDGRHTSLSRLAAQLNARGVPPPRGAAWTKAGVWGILTNPVYTGELHYARRHQGKYHTVTAAAVAKCRPSRTKRGKVRQVDAPADDVIVVRDAHPALVSREVYDRVRAKLAAANLNQTPRRRRNLDWPLSGLLCCGECSGAMWGLAVPATRDKTVELRKYACSTYLEKGKGACHFNAVPESELLGLVFEGIRKRFGDPATLRRLRADCERARKRRATADAGQADALKKHVKELSARIKGGTEKLAILPADIAADMVKAVQAWKGEREQAEGELRSLEAADRAALEDDRLVEEAMGMFARLSERVREAADEPAVKDAVQALVEKVELRFAHEPYGRRTRSRCTEVTVHFRPLQRPLAPVSLSRGQSAYGSRCSTTTG